MRLVMFAVLIMFTSCVSYEKTALVHSRSNENIGTHLTKKVFTMPNGKTYMMFSSSYRFGGGSLEVLAVPSKDSPNHNFEQNGGLVNLNYSDDETSIKIGGSVYHYSIRDIEGQKYYQFRVHRKIALVLL
jgi:hypothetical protein